MLCQPTFRISPDATTLFSSRIRRTRPYDSNLCMADASVASELVFITAPLAYQSQRECSGSGLGRTPSMTSSLANPTQTDSVKRKWITMSYCLEILSVKRNKTRRSTRTCNRAGACANSPTILSSCSPHLSQEQIIQQMQCHTA